LARIYSILAFTCTLFSSFPLSLSLNPLNVPAYCPLRGSLLLTLRVVYIISILFPTMLQNLLGDDRRQDFVQVMTSWVYVS